MLELGSPLILVNSWTTLFGGLSILAFHLANERLLGLGFRPHRWLALALLVNPLLHF